MLPEKITLQWALIELGKLMERSRRLIEEKEVMGQVIQSQERSIAILQEQIDDLEAEKPRRLN